MRTICTTCFGRKYVKQKPNNTEYMRKYRDSRKQFIVYMLPNSNYYVGQTQDWYDRKFKHIKDGNDISQKIILHECTSREEAVWYEDVYHDLGFPGRHIKKTPTKR